MQKYQTLVCSNHLLCDLYQAHKRRHIKNRIQFVYRTFSVSLNEFWGLRQRI